MADYVTALHELIRRLCTSALGLTDTNFFRPSGQRAPAGAFSQPYATIQIIASEMMSYNLRRYAATDPLVDPLGITTTADLLEVLETVDEFTASVQFWRDSAVDGVGRVVWGDGAHSRARSLVTRLELSPIVDLANQYGIGYSRASQVRDISAVVDGSNERRAQVDLTFYVANAEALALNMFRTATFSVKVQQPDNHINEVTS